ncbi:uncharacterized protein O3C94_008676 [Discoglossus pictus]
MRGSEVLTDVICVQEHIEQKDTRIQKHSKSQEPSICRFWTHPEDALPWERTPGTQRIKQWHESVYRLGRSCDEAENWLKRETRVFPDALFRDSVAHKMQDHQEAGIQPPGRNRQGSMEKKKTAHRLKETRMEKCHRSGNRGEDHFVLQQHKKERDPALTRPKSEQLKMSVSLQQEMDHSNKGPSYFLEELSRLEEERRKWEEKELQEEYLRKEENRDRWRDLQYLSFSQCLSKPWVSSYFKTIPMRIYCLPMCKEQQARKKRHVLHR